MNEKTIIDFLALQNKWWENKKKFPFKKIKRFKRSDYSHMLKSHMNSKESTVIIGPRGVGKSTVLFEIMRKLLGFPEDLYGNIDPKSIKMPEEKSNINERRVLYITFEEENLRNLKLLEILKIYAKYILKEDISQLTDHIFVFFDEIQNLGEWGDQIKIIQDLQYPIKIFITGSSSVTMINETSKAARRVELYSMYPLKFSDYLRYKINDNDFEEILKNLKSFRKEFFGLFKERKSQDIYDAFLQFYNDLKPWQTKIEIYFQEYLTKGGYPGLLKEDNMMRCASKLRDTFWLGFHKDLVLSKGIGDPKGMIELVEYIASISSSETNYTSLMDKSKSTTNTGMLKKYLYHLENTFLVDISNRFSKNITRRSSAFKIYLCDIAIRNMLQGMMNELLMNNQDELGLVLETLIFDHAARLFHKIRPGMPLVYWKDKKNNLEVDIILKLNTHAVPIEVKKSDSPNFSEVSGLRRFCKMGNPGLVICGKKIDLKENIIFLPHWLFILIC